MFYVSRFTRFRKNAAIGKTGTPACNESPTTTFWRKEMYTASIFSPEYGISMILRSAG